MQIKLYLIVSTAAHQNTFIDFPPPPRKDMDEKREGTSSSIPSNLVIQHVTKKRHYYE